ncbi:MAG: hypothetical protein LBU11_11600 [Zoogloeaceae bacterium]|jgi:hypothetical protein|nr:hypothetical protein [Zoogloeaceae bacterium]
MKLIRHDAAEFLMMYAHPRVLVILGCLLFACAQAQTRRQLLEIRRALDDALTLPIAELRARRHADYMLTPNRWTFWELLAAYFISARLADAESETFYADSKKPEAKAALERRLAEVELAIPHGAGD